MHSTSSASREAALPRVEDPIVPQWWEGRVRLALLFRSVLATTDRQQTLEVEEKTRITMSTENLFGNTSENVYNT